MKIIRAKTYGVCMGVKRALELVENSIEAKPEGGVCTVGPLIHNRRVLEQLESRGVCIISGPEEVSEGAVIIRAHGIALAAQKAFRGKNIELIDGTCPKVNKSQKMAADKSAEGFHVILAGDPGHGEVVAVAGYAEECTVVSSAEDVRELELTGDTFLMCQTTFREDKFDKILEVLKDKANTAGFKVEFERTVCPATVVRQNAVKDLAAEVDAVLVIGGKTSANTTRLFHIASESGKPSWHIEGADDVPPEIIGYNTIGITAGASAPDWIVEEVEAKLHILSKGE
ncbi:MAG: 4-hydroxy-3-methylbut-2-enyl diphosphate reductase [Spirochaetales bacterium]|nr:4-hydroxy-3-methylbut-2-enyl diphosphate reductase [Spirochaetales bacterium]